MELRRSMLVVCEHELLIDGYARNMFSLLPQYEYFTCNLMNIVMQHTKGMILHTNKTYIT